MGYNERKSMEDQRQAIIRQAILQELLRMHTLSETLVTDIAQVSKSIEIKKAQGKNTIIEEKNLKKLKKKLKKYLKKKTNIELVSHPETFNYTDEKDILTLMSKQDLEKIYTLNLSSTPIKISKNITYLGQIPKSNNFEIKQDSENDDNIMFYNVIEDSAIVYESEKGLFIITGCSHSGICNIIEYAKKVCNNNKIYGVIGGFHLFNIDDRLEKTINYFKENNIELIYPCHCTSLNVKIEMAKKLKIHEVGVGLELNI